MKDLEGEFGVTIFQRTTTGVVPTEAGEIILDKCRKISHLLGELRSEVSALKSSADDRTDHQLNIGISFTARCCFLPFLSSLLSQAFVISLAPPSGPHLEHAHPHEGP